MSDEWDFYFARVNDAVSSIFVDLGVRPEVPVEARPWLLWVWVPLRSPRDDGLSSSEEAPKLNELGDALDSAIGAACGAQYVGRITGSGRREFYYYASEPADLETVTARVMQGFEGYECQTGSAFEPDWDQYLNLLYPSATNLQRMSNRRLLEALEQDGDDHETPRKVDHWLYFTDEEGRAACRDTLEAIGFEVEDESLAEEGDESLPYGLVVSRIDSVDTHSINGVTLELARLAGEHRGDYDGWACEVTTAEAKPH